MYSEGHSEEQIHSFITPSIFYMVARFVQLPWIRSWIEHKLGLVKKMEVKILHVSSKELNPPSICLSTFYSSCLLTYGLKVEGIIWGKERTMGAKVQ